MLDGILKPKPKEEVMESLHNLKLPSYRFSSFLKLIDAGSAAQYSKWCTTVFHTNPEDMDITQFYDDSPWYQLLRKGCGVGSGFTSNANLRLMKVKNNYFAYPKGELNNILIKLYKS